MLGYLLKRLLLFVPTLLVISLLAFGLSRCTPGDPIMCYLAESMDGQFGLNPQQYERAYRRVAEKMGWDRPVFYFKLTSAAYPDSLYRIVIRDQRQCVEKLIAQSGNWPLVERYYQQIDEVHHTISALPDSMISNDLIRIRSIPGRLQLEHQFPVIRNMIDTMQFYILRNSRLLEQAGGAISELESRYREMIGQPRKARLYVPALYWYGLDNQYHHWLSNFIRGELGRSCNDGRPIFDKITAHLKWTLLINGLAIFIAYVLSIPLGVYSAFHKDSRFDRITSMGLFLLYSLPSFWVATLLVIFFTNPSYGMDWFPATGLGNLSPVAPFWERFRETAWHIVLPVFSLAYGALAFITRQMRAAVLDVTGSDYIRTARAKGLTDKQVIWKHAFRNALFPLITLFAAIFPSLLAGSVIIERIFNIPGMGLLLINSIYQKDWQVVYAILMMAAVVTIAGILLADILYALADPRVKFGKAEK